MSTANEGMNERTSERANERAYLQTIDRVHGGAIGQRNAIQRKGRVTVEDHLIANTSAWRLW